MRVYISSIFTSRGEILKFDNFSNFKSRCFKTENFQLRRWYVAKSVILGLSFCVFAGYGVLTYANDSLTYWLPDTTKTIT